MIRNVRNGLAARSIAFGAAAKVSGGLVVFLGLPVIAQKLVLSDYSLFLTAMTWASAAGIAFGAASTLMIRDLAADIARQEPGKVASTESRFLGLYLLLAVLTTGFAFPLLLMSSMSIGSQLAIAFALCLAVAQFVMQWGDAHRVATRTDHIASLWQITGSAALVLALVFFGGQGIWVVILVYFGCPALAQAALLAHLLRSKKLVRPSIGVEKTGQDLRRLTPIIGASLVDYVKIFGSGILVSLIAGDGAYARHLTLALLAARLVNPLALLIRPMLPAFLDATVSQDEPWLRAFYRLFLIGLPVSLATALLVGGVFPASLAGAFIPPDATALTRGDVICVALLIWGQGWSAILMPLHVAANRSAAGFGIGSAWTLLGLMAGVIATLGGHSNGMLWSISVSTAASSACLAYSALNKARRRVEAPGKSSTARFAVAGAVDGGQK